MTGTEPEEEAAERRLLALLGLLQSERSEPDPGGVRSVMQRVRWQRSVREVLDAIGGIASTGGEGVAAAVGMRGDERRGER